MSKVSRKNTILNTHIRKLKYSRHYYDNISFQIDKKSLIWLLESVDIMRF